MAERAGARAQLAAAEVRRADATGGRPALAAALRDRARVLGERARDLDRRVAELELAPPRAGVWVPADPRLGPGDWVPPGVPAGRVLDLSAVRARLVADQRLGPVLLSSLSPGDAVRVRTAAGTADARVLEVAPAGSTRLPSAALGLGGGGELAADAADPSAAAEPVFEVLVELDAGPAAAGLLPGQRVRGVFPLAAEPAGVSLVRWVRQLLLRR